MLFSDLISSLQLNYPVLSVTVSRDGPVSDLLLLDQSVHSYQEDTVYFGHPAQNQGPHHILCTEEKPYHHSHTNTAVIRSQDFIPVFNWVKQELTRSMRLENAYSKMLRMILGGKSLGVILNEAARQCGNALVILDMSGKILATSTPFEVQDPLWVASAERGFCPVEFMDHIKQLRTKKMLTNTSESFVSICETNGLVYLVSRIFAKDELLGYVFMFEEKTPINSQSQELLPVIALTAGEVILRYQSDLGVRVNLYHSLLHDMLAGISPEQANARITASELVFPAQMRVMVMRSSYYQTENTLRHLLQKELRKIFPVAPSILYQSSILQVVPLDSLNNEKISPTVLESLALLARDQNMILGFSNPFSSPTQFPQYYGQADKTLRLAQRLHMEGHLHYYEDFAFYALLNELPLDTHMGEFCHPALEQLKQYDQDNSTDLFKTLQVYTKTGFNQKKTAEILFLHRNTLNYRRGRIAEVCGIDYEDPGTLFSLLYSFQISRYWESNV